MSGIDGGERKGMEEAGRQSKFVQGRPSIPRDATGLLSTKCRHLEYGKSLYLHD